jgi:hypothetical protein
MKPILLSLVLVCTSITTLVSQIVNFSIPWNLKYQHTTTQNFSNEGRKVVVNTSTGDVYMAADITSDLNPQGVVDGQVYEYVSLLRLDEFGALIGQVDINIGQHQTTGFNKRSTFGLHIDGAGAVYLAYMSYNATSNYDVNIAKYGPSLGLNWLYTFNPSSSDQGLDFKVAPNGVAYALVKSNAGGNDRSRVIKANAAGSSMVPLYTFSSTADNFTTMDVDVNENIYVSGFRLTNNIKSISTASLTNFGTLRWLRTDNCGFPLNNHFARHITYGADGFVYITGQSQGTVQHGIDVVTMKFGSTNGKKIWESFVNFSLSDGGFFVSAHDLNNVYVAWTEGNNMHVEQLSSATGGSARRATYAPQPSSAFNAINGVFLTDFKVSPTGMIYATGTVIGLSPSNNQFASAFIVRINYFARGVAKVEFHSILPGDQVASSYGSSIALDHVRKIVYSCTDQAESHTSHLNEYAVLTSHEASGNNLFRNDSEASTALSIQPNPARDHIGFAVSEGSVSRIRIHDLAGRLITEKRFDGVYAGMIDLNQIPDGIYHLSFLMTDGTELNQKIIISNL